MLISSSSCSHTLQLLLLLLTLTRLPDWPFIKVIGRRVRRVGAVASQWAVGGGGGGTLDAVGEANGYHRNLMLKFPTAPFPTA